MILCAYERFDRKKTVCYVVFKGDERFLLGDE